MTVDYTQLDLHEIAGRSASWYADQPIPPRLIRDMERLPPTLNPMEYLALKAIARGLTRGEAAAERWVTEDTISKQRAKMRMRLGARDNAHAVAIGFSRGILTPEDLAA